MDGGREPSEDNDPPRIQGTYERKDKSSVTQRREYEKQLM